MSKKKHMYIRPPKGDTPVKVEPKFIDYDLPNRQGHQDPTYIVIHEVSLLASKGHYRSPKEFNMDRYANKISEDARNGRTIGYHYLVGDKQVYQFMEDDVATSHTGTEFGNHNSIGVERVICDGVNYEHATHNQAKLIATLMLKHNIPLDNVLTHKEMQRRFGDDEEQRANPKQCPGRMLAGFRGTVQDFKGEIKRCFMYGWFFNELLDEKTIEEIPQIQEIAKKRFAPKKEQKTRIVGLENLKISDLEI